MLPSVVRLGNPGTYPVSAYRVLAEVERERE
jgi:hypothetical protein